MAERVGFEPTVREADTRFRVEHIRPLCHLSVFTTETAALPEPHLMTAGLLHINFAHPFPGLPVFLYRRKYVTMCTLCTILMQLWYRATNHSGREQVSYCTVHPEKKQVQLHFFILPHHLSQCSEHWDHVLRRAYDNRNP